MSNTCLVLLYPGRGRISSFHHLPRIAYASIPSSSINLTTILITSSPPRLSPGFSTFFAMRSSTMPRSLATRTPIRAHPLSLSHPSTNRPRPMVSSSVGPENSSSVYALKARSSQYACVYKARRVDLRVKSRMKTLLVEMMLKYDIYAAFPENT